MIVGKDPSLRPCPFCGSEGIIMRDDEPDGYNRIGEWVECTRCMASGPYWYRCQKSHGAAVRSWNGRVKE